MSDLVFITLGPFLQIITIDRLMTNIFKSPWPPYLMNPLQWTFYPQNTKLNNVKTTFTNFDFDTTNF